MSIGPIFIRLLAAILAILIPFPIARYFHREHGSPWSLFRCGCLTFVISQVFHIPFNAIVLQLLGVQGELPSGASLVNLSIFLGLSAGFFEETSRYLAYRYWLVAPADRSFKSSLMFGVGHGGIESILLVGLGGIAQLLGMIVFRDADLESKGIPTDQVVMVEKQIADYWAVPWYGVLMGDLERIFAITAHIAMTVLVLQAFRRPGGLWWLASAILWHTGLDFLAVILGTEYNSYIAELAVGVWAVGSFQIIRYFEMHEEETDRYTEISDVDPPPSATAATVPRNSELQRLSNQ